MKRNNWFWLILLILILGGIGGVLFGRFLIPALSNVPGFSWAQKLESNNPVIINRREEVQLNEGANILELVRQASTYTVSLYSQTPNIKFLGNGIITSADGMVVVSRASLGNATSINVVTNDGTNYTGLVRAMDPRSELAVVTVTAKNLTFAQFADASNLQASQRLLFVGRSNDSFTHKFASGFVTDTVANTPSLDHVFSSESFENTIQSDAKLSADFVGGPVVNLDGRVVGMVNSSMGILIGENLQTAVSSFLQNGKIVRPAFGIKYLNLSQALAGLKGLPQAGLLVASVDENSPAKKAGLLTNDLIIAVDGADITNNNFEKIVNSHGLSPIPLMIIRNGSQQSISITLEAK